jgi:hypothetical protein
VFYDFTRGWNDGGFLVPQVLRSAVPGVRPVDVSR